MKFITLLLFTAPYSQYCLSLYHFNLQYVPGGLKGYFKTIFNLDLPEMELSGEEVEDRIIKESFEPLLDVYLSHPSWGADIELQGYMVEVMKERFPDVLSKLKELVGRGQIDLVSIHYSDQLFLAYPLEDMEWSLELNRKTFEYTGLMLSEVVFAQEGQAGEGMFRFLKERGYRIMVLAEGLFDFLHRDLSPSPLYRLEDFYVIIGGKEIDSDIKVKWIFFDDGELAVTGGANPYLGTEFKMRKDAVDELVSRIENLEKEGCRVVKISDYVREVTSFFSPPLLPPILDGTWHPERSMNFYRWMGGEGEFASYVDERDNEVLTANYNASLALRAAEVLLNEKNRIELKERLFEAKKLLLLAEVSDSTGWNPWTAEINYSLEKSRKAREIAEEIIGTISSGKVHISLKEGKTVDSPRREALKPGRLPVPYRVETYGFGFKTAEKEYEDIPGLYRLEISFLPEENVKRDFRRIEVIFPLFESRIEYSPGLSREIRSLRREDFSFNVAGFPLWNGLIGLGNGFYLIKGTGTVHLAGVVDFEKKEVRFVDETEDEPSRFVFFLYKGESEDALHIAEEINVYPVLSFGEEGCGCTSTSCNGYFSCFLFYFVIFTMRGYLRKLHLSAHRLFFLKKSVFYK